jgi:hypothetical protein
MFTKNLSFFGQILHPQWPTQAPKMGQKMDFVLYWLNLIMSFRSLIHMSISTCCRSNIHQSNPKQSLPSLVSQTLHNLAFQKLVSTCSAKKKILLCFYSPGTLNGSLGPLCLLVAADGEYESMTMKISELTRSNPGSFVFN